jgi:ubiquinone/menaquinone biosynthesis C-methylase UbiE/uncharacterized protein YbaR (Trm112 family)
MAAALTHPFRCPECAGPDGALEYRARDAETGAYVCEACGAWFPVELAIADFTPPDVRDGGRWTRFWDRHGAALELSAPTAAMPAGSTQVQREFFDGFVDDYDRIVAETSFWRAHDSLAVDAWVQRVPRRADVLDIGAGSGRCTVPLADRLDDGSEIVATDISFEMLRAAGDKLSARGTRDRVRLVAADSTRLAWLRPRSFDVAFAYGLLHHLDDPEPVWEGLDAVMRERASVLVHDNNATGVRKLFDLLMRRWRLWDAEHEGHPVIALADLAGWARGHGFAVRMRTSVFVPPHVCNMLSVTAARRLIEVTDRVMTRVPGVARHGGIILAEAYRGGPPLVMTA